MKPNKTSSAKAASIAGRIMSGGRYNHADLETLAASVLAQKLPAKSKRPVASKRKRV